MTLKDLSPKDISAALDAHQIVLIDVREPDEYASERIPGALLFPLSTFDPNALPDTSGRPVVFHCAAGMRSAKAVAMCQAAGLKIDQHMAGGLKAWKAAGLQTYTIDPATGRMTTA